MRRAGALHVEHVPNVADRYHERDPVQFPRTSRDAYLMDPKVQLRIHRELEAQGGEIAVGQEVEVVRGSEGPRVRGSEGSRVRGFEGQRVRGFENSSHTIAVAASQEVSRRCRPKEPEMPKHLECVIPDCEFAVTAATEEEILKAVAVHAAHAHGVTEIPPQLAAEVKAAIKDQRDQTQRQ